MVIKVEDGIAWIEKCECKRCGHKWFPRVENPEMCPACKSGLWRKEKK